MRRALPRGIALLALALLSVPMLRLPARSYGLSAQEVVTAEKLKSEAFQALRGGHFDRTNELLAQAASITHDPAVERMAGWTNNFESQRQEFVAQRHKQYDKLAGQIQLLLKKSKPDYAMDLL